ncbi:Uncharacterized protein Rs2_10853 [Raphanus sativus]|nr:Uncharacterized protein Rs2_10853 [Raphanus sativus]
MNPPPGGMIEMVNYGGKLLMLWESEFSNNRHSIYCEMIAFERRNGDEVWGNVEWANVVLTSRRSIDFVRTQESFFSMILLVFGAVELIRKSMSKERVSRQIDVSFVDRRIPFALATCADFLAISNSSDISVEFFFETAI